MMKCVVENEHVKKMGPNMGLVYFEEMNIFVTVLDSLMITVIVI